jgi:hypothetical protein
MGFALYLGSGCRKRRRKELNATGVGMFVGLAICSFLVGTAAWGQDEAVELARSDEALDVLQWPLRSDVSDVDPAATFRCRKGCGAPAADDRGGEAGRQGNTGIVGVAHPLQANPDAAGRMRD